MLWMIAAAISNQAFAGTTWDGGDIASFWTYNNNWNPDGSPTPGSSVALTFTGGIRLDSINNYAGFNAWQSILFDSNAGSFTMTSSAGANWDLYFKIENSSVNAQSISIDAISLKSSVNGNEFDPSAGNLTINAKDIYTNGSNLNVFGTKTLTINNTGGSGIQAGGALVLGSSGTGFTGIVTLNGANSYTGGTTINGATATLNINNATAIGTGTLTFKNGATFDNTSASAVTLANNNAISLQASPTFTGTKDLSFGSGVVTISGANRTLTVTNAGATLTVGAIAQDIPGRNFTKSGAGTLAVTGNSTYSGTTLISGTLRVENNGGTTTGKLGGTTGITITTTNSGTLLLSGSNTVTDRINDSATVTINGGGKFSTGGLSEGTRPSLPSGGTAGVAGMGALTLLGTSGSHSTIDFLTGANGSSLVFSSLAAGVTSSTFVDIKNWTGAAGTDSGATGNDRLLFATDPGLTNAQLANFAFFNDSNAAFATGGTIIPYGNEFEIVPVPEPSTWAAGLLTAAALGYSQRKRFAKRLRVIS